MCGIAGVLYADPSRMVARPVLQRMANSLAHRGPDGEGFWTAPGIGLAHRRLSIIDLTTGDQPIANEDDSVRVIFNGEIYNFESLRAALESKGHRFRSQTDTETLVHLYEEHGDQLVSHLRGMFAFAVWDERRRRLTLARDRVGIKPLYLYRDDEKLVFASELKSILAHPEVPRSVDVSALDEYLAYGMVAGTGCIFQRITKLPAAHVLVVDANRLAAAPRRYWQLQFAVDERPTADEWQDEVRHKIDETIKLHLIADVPVGAFLSGGVDSSVIVARAAGAARGQLQTFSIGFDEEPFSELPFAEAVGRRYNTRHTSEIAIPDAGDLIERLAYHFDEPFADSSALPTLMVSRLAAGAVKVVLSGDGGDELFGGYTRYAHDLRESAIRRRLPSAFQQHVLAPLAGIWPQSDGMPRPLRAKALLTNLSLADAAAYANSLAICRQPLRRTLLAPDVVESLNGHNPAQAICEAFGHAPAGDTLAGMIAADVGVRLPDDYLVKVDRASMAYGLEVRPPFVDHELLELAARIPSRFKVHRGRTKWIVKEAFRDELPADILQRPKRGFEIPVNAWLRGPLRERFESSVLTGASSIGDLIDRRVVDRMFTRHVNGHGRYGHVLWSVFVLARWAEHYLDGA